MKQVLQEALALTPAERYQLAMQLLISLEPVVEGELTQQQRAELDRRIQALDSGEDAGISGKDFLDMLKARSL